MTTPTPSNSASFTLSEILAATAASVVSLGPATGVCGVETDTRVALEGRLFVAILGERFDGHDFVEQAATRGATTILAERDITAPAGVTVLRVQSTLTALGRLAHAHRCRWGGQLVAVGGSAGKTTTKTLVAAALEVAFPDAVWKTPGNLNNRIGVPMVLLALKAQHRAAVIEVGTSLPGEIAALAQVVEPDVAVLTLIDLEHAEGLGSLDDIEAEEGALLWAVRLGGAVIYNADDHRVRRQAHRAPVRTRLGYGVSEQADLRLIERGASGKGARLRVRRKDSTEVMVSTPLVGEAGALATLAGLAALELLSGAPADGGTLSGTLLKRAEPPPGRLVPVKLADDSVILDDTYNANPASVRSSVNTAREFAAERGARLVLVIGEMLELGSQASKEHENLGRWLASSGAEVLLAVSGQAQLLLEPCARSGMTTRFCEDADGALETLLAVGRARDVILVKASRGVRAERIVEGMIDSVGRAA